MVEVPRRNHANCESPNAISAKSPRGKSHRETEGTDSPEREQTNNKNDGPVYAMIVDDVSGESGKLHPAGRM